MSNYGEIVEPVSRTAWEDWDDTTEENNIKLNWSKNAATPKNINNLFILEGRFLHDCVTSQSNSKLELLDYIKEVGLSLYKMRHSNNYICVINNYNLLHSSEIVELLKPYVVISSDVMSIQTKPFAEYQSFKDTNQNCIMCRVSTTKSPSDQFHKLEPPNIISGVSAGVISLREHLNLVGTALVCFVDHPDGYSQEFQKLLNELCINYQADSKTNSLFNSNLYI